MKNCAWLRRAMQCTELISMHKLKPINTSPAPAYWWLMENSKPKWFWFCAWVLAKYERFLSGANARGLGRAGAGEVWIGLNSANILANTRREVGLWKRRDFALRQQRVRRAVFGGVTLPKAPLRVDAQSSINESCFVWSGRWRDSPVQDCRWKWDCHYGSHKSWCYVSYCNNNEIGDRCTSIHLKHRDARFNEDVTCGTVTALPLQS